MSDTPETTDTTQDDERNPLSRGKDAVVVAQAASDLHDAVDVERLLGDDTAGDPVDADQLADALGRPTGRLLALSLVDDSGTTGFIKRAITEHVSRSVSTETFRIVVEKVDTEDVTEMLVEFDEGTPGPSLSQSLGSGTSTDA